MTHEFWKSIHGGARQAANEYGVEIFWKGPRKEDDRAQQITVAENLLSRFPEVDGIFCPDESSTFGTLRALQEAGKAGEIVFAGFDSSPKLVQGLGEGHIHGLVLQDPVKKGYLGVQRMVFHLKGQSVEKRIDTGVYMVTKENMDNPEIRSLLMPDATK